MYIGDCDRKSNDFDFGSVTQYSSLLFIAATRRVLPSCHPLLVTWIAAPRAALLASISGVKDRAEPGISEDGRRRVSFVATNKEINLVASRGGTRNVSKLEITLLYRRGASSARESQATRRENYAERSNSRANTELSLKVTLERVKNQLHTSSNWFQTLRIHSGFAI